MPHEQQTNPYLDIRRDFRHFFVRKVLLLKYSYAFVVMPGGAGTMDEFFETLTLIQTGKIRPFPLVLVGRDYWQPLEEMVQKMVREGTVSPHDPNLFLITDSLEEALRHVEKAVSRDFGLGRRRRRPRPQWWLGERSRRDKV